MNPDAHPFVFWTTWIVSGLGFGLVLLGLLRGADPIRRQRLQDCGVVLIFGGVLTRVMIQDERGPIDWVLAGLALIYIPLSLWRLSRTQSHVEGRPE